MLRRKGFWIAVAIFMAVFMPATLFLVIDKVFEAALTFIQMGTERLGNLPTPQR